VSRCVILVAGYEVKPRHDHMLGLLGLNLNKEEVCSGRLHYPHWGALLWKLPSGYHLPNQPWCWVLSGMVQEKL